MTAPKEDIVQRLRWSGQDAITKHASLGMHMLHADAAAVSGSLKHRKDR